MKKIISLLLCLLIIYAAAPLAQAEATPAFTVTEYKNEESEAFLWDSLSKYSPSKELTAAILGFFWRESFFRSDAIANWPMLKTHDLDMCIDFTTQIDEGLKDGSTKEYFVQQSRNYGGYGLGQWYSTLYLESLYDFAQEWGTSIADAEMQCAFTIWSIENQQLKYIHILEDRSNIHTNSMWMGAVYDGSSTAAITIYTKAKEFYKKYT